MHIPPQSCFTDFDILLVYMTMLRVSVNISLSTTTHHKSMILDMLMYNNKCISYAGWCIAYAPAVTLHRFIQFYLYLATTLHHGSMIFGIQVQNDKCISTTGWFYVYAHRVMFHWFYCFLYQCAAQARHLQCQLLLYVIYVCLLSSFLGLICPSNHSLFKTTFTILVL